MPRRRDNQNLGRTQTLVLRLLAERSKTVRTLAYDWPGLTDSAARGAVDRLRERGLVDRTGWDAVYGNEYGLTERGAAVEAGLNVDPADARGATLAERPWSIEDRGYETPCWVWQRAIASGGYAITHVERRTYRAHRLAYAERYGPIPDGAVVCHKCDVRSCVNPDHLFVGTQKQNMEDMDAKARRGTAKLTQRDVRQIRRTYTGRQGELRALALQYGVGDQAIRNVVQGRTWRHVHEAPHTRKEPTQAC